MRFFHDSWGNMMVDRGMGWVPASPTDSGIGDNGFRIITGATGAPNFLFDFQIEEAKTPFQNNEQLRNFLRGRLLAAAFPGAAQGQGIPSDLLGSAQVWVADVLAALDSCIGSNYLKRKFEAAPSSFRPPITSNAQLRQFIQQQLSEKCAADGNNNFVCENWVGAVMAALGKCLPGAGAGRPQTRQEH